MNTVVVIFIFGMVKLVLKMRRPVRDCSVVAVLSACAIALKTVRDLIAWLAIGPHSYWCFETPRWVGDSETSAKIDAVLKLASLTVLRVEHTLPLGKTHPNFYVYKIA